MLEFALSLSPAGGVLHSVRVPRPSRASSFTSLREAPRPPEPVWQVRVTHATRAVDQG